MQQPPKLGKLALTLSTLFVTTPVSLAFAAYAPDAPDLSTVPLGDMQRVEVTAARMRSERVELSPKVGTTVYTIDKHMVDNLGQGEGTPFNEVLLRLPGVAQDSKASGSIHVRDDHANV